MKTYIFLLFVILTQQSIAQFSCDSIQFNSTSETVDLPTDQKLWVNYTYDGVNNPLIVYPFYYVVLDDTSEIVVRQEIVGSYIGDDDSIMFTVIYKNPLTPHNYAVTGTFDIHDPNANPTFLCSFPITITVSNLSVSLEEKPELTISVAPNPVSDVVTIHSGSTIQDVRIINFLGQDVYRTEGNSKAEMSIDLSELNSGWYRLIVEGEDGISSTNLVRE